jgi:hypothetical protein
MVTLGSIPCCGLHCEQRCCCCCCSLQVTVLTVVLLLSPLVAGVLCCNMWLEGGRATKPGEAVGACYCNNVLLICLAGVHTMQSLPIIQAALPG